MLATSLLILTLLLTHSALYSQATVEVFSAVGGLFRAGSQQGYCRAWFMGSIFRRRPLTWRKVKWL